MEAAGAADGALAVAAPRGYRQVAVACTTCGTLIGDASQYDCPRCAEPVRLRPRLLQAHVDSLVRTGLLFAVLWMGGIGSLYACFLAARIAWLIASAREPVEGALGAFTMAILGTLGLLTTGVAIMAML